MSRAPAGSQIGDESMAFQFELSAVALSCDLDNWKRPPCICTAGPYVKLEAAPTKHETANAKTRHTSPLGTSKGSPTPPTVMMFTPFTATARLPCGASIFPTR